MTKTIFSVCVTGSYVCQEHKYPILMIDRNQPKFRFKSCRNRNNLGWTKMFIVKLQIQGDRMLLVKNRRRFAKSSPFCRPFKITNFKVALFVAHSWKPYFYAKKTKFQVIFSLTTKKSLIGDNFFLILFLMCCSIPKKISGSIFNELPGIMITDFFALNLSNMQEQNAII